MWAFSGGGAGRGVGPGSAGRRQNQRRLGLTGGLLDPNLGIAEPCIDPTARPPGRCHIWILRERPPDQAGAGVEVANSVGKHPRGHTEHDGIVRVEFYRSSRKTGRFGAPSSSFGPWRLK